MVKFLASLLATCLTCCLIVFRALGAKGAFCQKFLKIVLWPLPLDFSLLVCGMGKEQVGGEPSE